MANIEASMFRGKNNWALLMGPDGFIAEGSINFFIVKDGRVITPEAKIIWLVFLNYILKFEQLRIECIKKFGPYEIYMQMKHSCWYALLNLTVFGFNELNIGDDKFRV